MAALSELAGSDSCTLQSSVKAQLRQADYQGAAKHRMPLRAPQQKSSQPQQNWQSAVLLAVHLAISERQKAVQACIITLVSSIVSASTKYSTMLSHDVQQPPHLFPRAI